MPRTYTGLPGRARSVPHSAALAEAQQLTRKIAGEIHLTMGQFAAHRRTSPPPTVVSEHDAIMDAIRTGDVEAAQVALAEHLSRAHERVRAQITGGGTFCDLHGSGSIDGLAFHSRFDDLRRNLRLRRDFIRLWRRVTTDQAGPL